MVEKIQGKVRELANGLKFPEGPVALADGSVVLVEIGASQLTRIHADGKKEVVCRTGGGPNGAAIGPDGKCYITNNGGFEWHQEGPYLRPLRRADDYKTGSIQRVDLATGKLETIYTECNGVALKGPNDLVFDAHGGFYFTDLGKTYDRLIDRGAVFYAKADGSSITEVIFPMLFPNGTSLSPDGKTLYVAETDSARLWAFPVQAPGKVGREATSPAPHGGKLLYGAGGYERYDSMAVEANGNICVATLVNGGISVIDPKGGLTGFWAANEPYCTNVCFGGAGLKTAYATMSGTGKLLAIDWPRAGLNLEHNA